MKLNLDCVRDVLLTVEENLNFPATWTVGDLRKHLTSYSAEELKYTCIKLFEGGYLNVTFYEDKPPSVSNHSFDKILSLTFQGHEFLETVRPKEVYDQASSALKDIGTKSVKLMSSVASSVLTAFVSSKLGL